MLTLYIHFPDGDLGEEKQTPHTLSDLRTFLKTINKRNKKGEIVKDLWWNDC